MALSVLQNTYRSYHFKFWLSPNQTAVTSSPRVSGSQFTQS